MANPPPLAKKLGIDPGTSLALVHPPKGFSIECPDGVRVLRTVRNDVNVILSFFDSGKILQTELERLTNAVYPDGSLWVSWPKKSSGIVTELTDHAVRSIVLPLGLVDNKVCAIDATYTALRFVWRRPLRTERI
jgi:hypothetical protein